MGVAKRRIPPINVSAEKRATNHFLDQLPGSLGLFVFQNSDTHKPVLGFNQKLAMLRLAQLFSSATLTTHEGVTLHPNPFFARE